MALYAVGQKSIAAEPADAYPGDYYGMPGRPGTSTESTGLIAQTPIAVGQFAWIVDGSSQAYQGTQAQFLKDVNSRPVFVPRLNNNVYSNLELNLGHSLIIPTGTRFEACANGSFYCAIFNSLNAGGSININDLVLINIATGTTAVMTGDCPDDYYKTSYTVVNANVQNPFGLNMVVISNVQAI